MAAASLFGFEYRASDLLFLVPGPLVDLRFGEAGLAAQSGDYLLGPGCVVSELVDEQLDLALVLAQAVLQVALPLAKEDALFVALGCGLRMIYEWLGGCSASPFWALVCVRVLFESLCLHQFVFKFLIRDFKRDSVGNQNI